MKNSMIFFIAFRVLFFCQNNNASLLIPDEGPSVETSNLFYRLGSEIILALLRSKHWIFLYRLGSE